MIKDLPEYYSIVLRSKIVNGEVIFEGTVAELPDVAEYASSPAEAYALVLSTIETSQEVFRTQGKDFPAPLPYAPDCSPENATLFLKRFNAYRDALKNDDFSYATFPRMGNEARIEIQTRVEALMWVLEMLDIRD